MIYNINIINGDTKKMSKKKSKHIKEEMIEKAKSSLLHRNVLGALGMLLPVISIFSGLFVRDKVPEWWWSISVTYYISPALSIILGSCALFLICYRSYNKIDTIRYSNEYVIINKTYFNKSTKLFESKINFSMNQI